MNDLMGQTEAALVGFGLGGVFFGGLWWTIRMALPAKQPAIWFLASLMARTGVVLAGFYVVGVDHPLRLVAALLGFIAARAFVGRWIHSRGEATVAP